MLAYLNTLVMLNEPIIRPMFYHFPIAAIDDEDQFLLGPALMVVPILNANESYTEKTIFFPDKYFDYRFGHAVLETGMAKYPVYESPLQIFIRSGRIVPIHESEVNIAFLTKSYRIESS